MPAQQELKLAYEELKLNPGQKHLEEVISQYAAHSCDYAYFLNVRFVLGEEVVLKSIHSKQYKKYILKEEEFQ